MANFIRSAKSGSDWTSHELIAYNIIFSPLSPGEFFTTPDPTLDHIDSAILNSPPGDIDPALSDVATEYLAYLDLARGVQEDFVDDFAAETLKLLGFNERLTVVSTCFTIPLIICGESNRVAQPDVCLLHRLTFVLLVLAEDKTFTDKARPEVQVVAEAIAAFQYNNDKRSDHDLPPLDAMTIPCITMSATCPTFYLVPVTTELSNAVTSGQYPATQTQVLQCATVATRATHIWNANTGMEDTEYRKLALKRFLAFKTLAKSHWEHILEGV